MPTVASSGFSVTCQPLAAMAHGASLAGEGADREWPGMGGQSRFLLEGKPRARTPDTFEAMADAAGD